VRDSVQCLGSGCEAVVCCRHSRGNRFECGQCASVNYKAFFGFWVGKTSDIDMLVTVKNTAPEMKLLLLFILLMCVMSSHSSELGNCRFNLTYNGQLMVYDFSR
jgi:hypothetical protein